MPILNHRASAITSLLFFHEYEDDSYTYLEGDVKIKWISACKALTT